MKSIELKTLQKLEELQMKGEPDLVVRLIDIFSETAPKTIQTLGTATSEADAQTIERASHNLKSSAAHVGARKLSEICAEMERVARIQSSDGQQKRMNDLLSEFECVKVELAAIKSSRI